MRTLPLGLVLSCALAAEATGEERDVEADAGQILSLGGMPGDAAGPDWTPNTAQFVARLVSQGKRSESYYKGLVARFVKQSVPPEYWPFLITVAEIENEKSDVFNTHAISRNGLWKWGHVKPAVKLYLEAAGAPLPERHTGKREWYRTFASVRAQAKRDPGLAAYLLLAWNSDHIYTIKKKVGTSFAGRLRKLTRTDRALFVYLSGTGNAESVSKYSVVISGRDTARNFLAGGGKAPIAVAVYVFKDNRIVRNRSAWPGPVLKLYNKRVWGVRNYSIARFRSRFPAIWKALFGVSP